MGFNFIDSETRNPTNQTPELTGHGGIERPKTAEEWQAEKQNQVETLQAKLAEIEEFIDENSLLQKFYAWQELRRQLEGTSAEVIE